MLIEFEQVAVTLSQAQVLRDISATLSEHRIGVVGPNGSGKSTLARLLNGLLLPTAGRVLVDGFDTREDKRAVRRRVGFVFQNPENQIVFPIVREDLTFGLKNMGLDPSERERRVAAKLTELGLTSLADRSSYSLSGGERQLVALASVLVMEPGLIVFDEPTTQLDLRNRNVVRRAIAALDCPVVVISHDLALLEDFDRVLVMLHGRIAADDAPAHALSWYRKRCA